MSATSSSEDRLWLEISETAQAGAARRAAAALGEEAGLAEAARADLAIVATEMATNLARHAVGGVLLLRLRRQDEVTGVELVAIDRGPGMSDVTESARDGHTTAGTLGIGLGSISRQATECHAYSKVGSGTVLAATVWSGPATSPPWVAGVSRPIAGEQVCGDSYAAREIDGRRQVLVCDGLGHGPLASVAARGAVAGFLSAPALRPKALLDRLHEHVQHTRGVVAAVAELEADVVRFAGVGNIAATIVDGVRRRAMVSFPGIVGQPRRESKELEYALPGGALVILHSDGLTDKWDLGAYPGLVRQAPVVVAATVLRDAARRRDDAAVLVARSR